VGVVNRETVAQQPVFSWQIDLFPWRSAFVPAQFLQSIAYYYLLSPMRDTSQALVLLPPLCLSSAGVLSRILIKDRSLGISNPHVPPLEISLLITSIKNRIHVIVIQLVLSSWQWSASQAGCLQGS
jgi:hypothetical protein